MKGDALYAVLSRTLDVTVWGGELIGDTDLPSAGPAVFVANHAGALGPIAVTSSIPRRLHPWVTGDMMDLQTAGPYLLDDFVRPSLHVPDPLAAPLAMRLAHVAVWLLRTIGGIPVFHDRDLIETYRISDEYLAMGRSLLIFPEDPKQPLDDRTGMRPFKTGFAHVGSIFAQRAGRALSFYPVAVHRSRLKVEIGEIVTYNPRNSEAAERRRVARTVEAIIAGMLTGGSRPLGEPVGQPY